jgi:hypothetical protein
MPYKDARKLKANQGADDFVKDRPLSLLSLTIVSDNHGKSYRILVIW